MYTERRFETNENQILVSMFPADYYNQRSRGIDILWRNL